MSSRIREGYPWPGRRLAPETLREWLSVALPPDLTPIRPEGLTTLADLDSSVWGVFGADRCYGLADLVVSRVRECSSGYSLPGTVGQRRLPALPHGVGPEDLPLSTRTRNTVVRARLRARLADLSILTVQDILQLQGMGAKGLVELLVALEEAVSTNAVEASARGDGPDAFSATDGSLAAGEPFPEEQPRGDGEATFFGGLTISDVAHLGMWCRGEAVSLPSSIAYKRLPPLPLDLHADDLALAPRTRNIINSGEYAEIGGWLRSATIGDLLRIPGFGRNGLSDLLDGIQQYMGAGPPRADITALAQRIVELSHVHDVDPEDPRVQTVARAVCRQGETIEMAARRLIARAHDPAHADRLAQCLDSLVARLSRIGQQTLEEELTDITASVSDARNSEIWARCRGWDGKGGVALQTVGDEFGLTRERVRQLCVKVEKGLRGTRPFAPVLARALQVAAEQAPTWSDEVDATLRQEHMTRGRFAIGVLHDAAALLGLESPIVVDTVAGRPWVRRADDDEVPDLDETARVVRRCGRRAIEHIGAARIQDIVTTASREAETTLAPAFVQDVLSHQDGFQWLDELTGWFWNGDIARNRLLNQIEKVMAVAGAVNVNELRTAVARHYRMEGQSPPAQILAELCRQIPGYLVTDDIVRATPPLDHAKILADVERTFVEVLRAHGSIMTRAALEKICRERGMNRATFYVYLGNSPILTCPRRGVYALVGSVNMSPQLEDLVVRPIRARLIVDSGWTADRKLWIVYRLSENMLASGTFGIPSGMKSHLLGDFILRTEDGLQRGTLRCRETGAWGLRSFYQHCGGKPGDCLALVFDLGSRQAFVRLGDESLVPQ